MKLRFSGGAGGQFIQLNKKAGRLLRIIIAVVSACALFWLVLRFSPYPELRDFLNRPCSVRYYDRNGLLLQITALEGGLRRERLGPISDQVKEIFVFAEDRRFYRHLGIDGFAIVRAIYQNIAEGRRVSGASTITMQLARLVSVTGGGGRKLSGKISEALNAFRLETRLSKNEILELYLASLPFGFNTEGVASAGRTFFASDLSMLSPAQIFCLAVIPRRPGFYSPLENPEACIAAASELQARFGKNRKLASKQPLLAEIHSGDWGFAAASARRFSYPLELPHLIRHIASQSGEKNESSKQKKSGELRLSIDLSLQRYLENSIAGNVERYYSSRLTNGAALVIDNESGEILAWAGSADYNNADAAGQIDGVLALNQPGSSMKPFLYAMALEKGFKPTDVLADVPMNFGETEVYLPRNFNNRFNGPMLFRSALASSLNIPAVYLLYRLGVQNYSEKLLSLGFYSIEHSAEDAGLGLALGNAPVSLRELVRAFSVFPRDGVNIPLTWELALAEPVQAEPGPEKQGFPNGIHSGRIYSDRIYSEDTARIICSFLSDPGARVLAFGSGRNFRTTFSAIFKTGTANQYQSIVALGATPRYTVGVWMGNFTGETVIGKTGSSIPAAIVRDTLVLLNGAQTTQGLITLGGRSSVNSQSRREFQAPENWLPQRVCAVSGMAPSEACLSVISEYIKREQFLTGERRDTCTWHRMVNGRSEVSYPAEYQAWFNAASRQGSLDYGSRPLEILSPREGFVYLSSPGIGRDEIPVEVIGGNDEELRVYFDNRFFIVKRPFVFYLEKTPGLHTLRVQNGDEEEEIRFEVER